MIQTVIETLIAKAFSQGKEYPVYNRFALYEGCMYYNLADEEAAVLCADESGINTCREPPVRLIKRKTLLPQPVPQKGKSFLKLMKKYCHFASCSDRILHNVILIVRLITGIEQPIAICKGSKGSSKTTSMEMDKRCLDISSSNATVTPENEEDFLLLLESQDIVCLDNMDSITRAQANIFCQVATGATAVKRKKYSDSELCEINIRSTACMNGIHLLSDRSDFLERCVFLNMKTISEKAAEKKFDIVMSWKINRLSRKLEDAIKIVNTLDRYGISHRSYSEPFESDTPAGKMQFQMMALAGELERNTIAQNVKMGMKAKARAGEWCGGIAPLGCHWVPVEGTEDSARKKPRLEIDEKEAEIIKIIYGMYASGKGCKAIANYLNKKGYQTKLGKAFSAAQLRTMLTNPVYIGKVRFNVRRDWNEKRRNNINPDPIIVEGIHEAIITEEQWNQVQFLISQKSGKPSRIYDGEYPLTGILKCPEYGAGMVISRVINKRADGSRHKLAYYACGNWKNKGSAVCHGSILKCSGKACKIK